MNIPTLLKETFSPRTSFTLLLGGIAFALSIFVIYVKDQYRQHFIHLESLKVEHGKLETEWSELLLEESTWSSRTRVTNLATQKLGMIAIQPADIRMLSLEQLQADSDN
jgi:cell division protein FtsL